MVDEITNALMNAIEALKKQPPSRATAVAVTQAETALLWWREAQRLQQLEI